MNRTLILTTFVVAMALAAWWIVPTGPSQSLFVPSESPQANVDSQRHAALARVEPSLDWADEQCRGAVDERLKPLQTFFIKAKKRTPNFADYVLGWGSKWRFVADRMPFTSGGRHDEYLRKVCAEQWFAEKDLVRAIELAVSGYADSMESTENQMLVRIRDDLGDLPLAKLPEFSNGAALSAAYKQALERAMERVGAEVKADVASLVLSAVAQEVLTQVAIRMGVSAGILSVGAGSSWATLGVGLVVGVIVDQIISWIWDWWADPRGNLAIEMNAKLDQLQLLLIEGDDMTPGLRTKLTQYAQQRAAVRRAAVEELISTATTGMQKAKK
jgi:hypothetical protein